jgi:predicted transcriptional regulator
LSDRESSTSRSAILAILRQRKGVHKSELCRLTGKGWGTISHHVYVLIEAGQIITEVHGRQLWVFLPDIPETERDWIVATHVPDRLRILDRILGHRGATIEALSGEMAVSKKVIRTHLSHLRRIGAVSRSKDHPPKYEPADRLKDK